MASSSKAPRQKGNQDQVHEQPPRSEWLVATFGLLVVLVALGVLIYQAVSGGESPPDITIRVVAVQSVGKEYLVQLEVTNQGGATAAGLTVEGTLKQGEREIETSEATLDYVPGRSKREAGLFFSEDPRQSQLELRAFGYQEP